jgi:HAD superfamily hydrolase (TIGR01509 family)
VIEAVLFDGDQTLWDFQKVMRTALLAVVDDIRAARPGAAADALTVADLQRDRNAVAQELLGVEFNLARLRRLGFARTLQRLPTATDDQNGAPHPALAEQLADAYFRYRDQDPALFDDTLACLESLRADYRLGLLSNGSRRPETIGLGGIFEVVVFAQDHHVAKPDRGIFEVVERQLQMAPTACVLVGDHPLNDVVGAKRSGWRAVWIDRDGDGTYLPPPGTTDGPDAVITSLVQLPAALTHLRPESVEPH